MREKNGMKMKYNSVGSEFFSFKKKRKQIVE